MRSTLRIDDDLMIELKARAHAESVSLTHVVNRTLRAGLARPKLVDLDKAAALAARLEDAANGEPAWTSQPMCARVDLDDKEVVYALVDDDGA